MPGRLSRAEGWLCFAVAAALDTASGLRSSPQVLDGQLLNPDSYMRMVRLRDMMAAGTPLHAVLRDGSGEGTVLHWSHLLDAVLVLLALPFRLLIPGDAALEAAALLVGPLSVGCAGAAAAWVLAPLTIAGTRWMAAAVAGLAPPVIVYGFPGVAHHHAALGVAALLLAGAAGRVAAGTPRAGWLLGSTAGLGIWLSPEAMPFALLAFGGGGVAWLSAARPEPIAAGLARGGFAFLSVTLLALAIDPPSGGRAAMELDRISAAYVLLAAITTLVALVLTRLADRRWLGVLLGAAGIAVWLTIFPDVLRGPDAAAPEAAAMFANIEEMLPVAGWVQAILFLGDGTIALLFCLAVAWRGRSWPWLYATGAVLFMLALGALHIRFATYATLAGAAVLPAIMNAGTRRFAGKPNLMALGRVGMLVLALAPTRADGIAAGFGGGPAAAAAATAAPCPVAPFAPHLAALGDAVVLSDINDVPELLYRSTIHTVASLYHRNVPAFLRMRDAWREVPGAMPGPALLATKARYVLVCPAGPRSAIVAGAAPTTLLDRLRAGDPPPWLRRVVTDPASGFELFAVDTP